MEQKIFEYVFSRADYDYLQKSVLSRDLMGSSWKGEELITLYQDRVVHTIDQKIVGEYPLSQYRAFIAVTPGKPADALSGDWKTVTLLKKRKFETIYGKYIQPSLQQGAVIRGYADGIKFKIKDSKKDAFITALRTILPETSMEKELPLKNRLVALIIAIIVLPLILVIFHYSSR